MIRICSCIRIIRCDSRQRGTKGGKSGHPPILFPSGTRNNKIERPELVEGPLGLARGARFAGLAPLGANRQMYGLTARRCKTRGANSDVLTRKGRKDLYP